MLRSLLLLVTAASLQAAVDFPGQIQPILTQQCLGCHSAERGAGGLRLHSREALLKGGKSGAAVVAGKPDQSPLLISVNLPPNKPGAMPPGGPQLPADQRELLRTWVAEGAPWPEGVTLGGPKPTTSLKSEQAVVERLHKRIAANAKEKTPAEMKPHKVTIPGTEVAFEMVPIPGGEFTMGTPENEPGRKKDEGPQHKLKVEPFWMGAREVTWDEYRLFMFAKQAGETAGQDEVIDAVSRPTRPYVEMSFGMGIEGFPAISMTQHAANKYAQWLSAKTGQFYRLPTEAEWEYACRAGTANSYSFGSDAAQTQEYAWYADNSNGKYQKVGTRKPNPWGLYDMHGNVMEWTLDQYDPAYYATNGTWNKATQPYPHAVRGGSWNDDPSGLRCGARVGSDSSWKMQDPQLPKSIWYHTDAQWLGFRLIRPLKVPGVMEMFHYWNSGVEKE